LIAADHNSKFANPDGHLSVALTLPVNTDDQNLEPTLNIPAREFPPTALDSPIKLRGVVVVDGQSIYSDMVDLTAPLPPDTTSDPVNAGDGTEFGVTMPSGSSGNVQPIPQSGGAGAHNGSGITGFPH
jgi:hypothetical protein